MTSNDYLPCKNFYDVLGQVKEHVKRNYFFLEESALAVESTLWVVSVAAFAIESAAATLAKESAILAESTVVSSGLPVPQAANAPSATTNNNFFILKL